MEEERTCFFLWAYCRLPDCLGLLRVSLLHSSSCSFLLTRSLNPICNTCRNSFIASTPLPPPESQTPALRGWSPFCWDVCGHQTHGAPPRSWEMSAPIDWSLPSPRFQLQGLLLHTSVLVILTSSVLSPCFKGRSCFLQLLYLQEL